MDFRNSWDKSVIRLGRVTVLCAMIASFFPNLFLWIFYGVAPVWTNMLPAWAAVATAYGAFYIVQPTSCYPVLGTAGTYMGVLAGSMTSMRLPAAATAQDVVGTEPGSDQAEIISTMGIAGSVVTSVGILTVFIFFGTVIMSFVPEELKSVLSALILPSLYGALLIQFSIKRPQILLYALPIVLLVKKFAGLPSWAVTMIAVFGNLIITRILYKKGIIK